MIQHRLQAVWSQHHPLPERTFRDWRYCNIMLKKFSHSECLSPFLFITYGRPGPWRHTRIAPVSPVSFSLFHHLVRAALRVLLSVADDSSKVCPCEAAMTPPLFHAPYQRLSTSKPEMSLGCGALQSRAPHCTKGHKERPLLSFCCPQDVRTVPFCLFQSSRTISM